MPYFLPATQGAADKTVWGCVNSKVDNPHSGDPQQTALFSIVKVWIKRDRDCYQRRLAALALPIELCPQGGKKSRTFNVITDTPATHERNDSTGRLKKSSSNLLNPIIRL